MCRRYNGKQTRYDSSHIDGKSGNWFNHFGKLSGVAIETEHMLIPWPNNYTVRVYVPQRYVHMCTKRHIPAVNVYL